MKERLIDFTMTMTIKHVIFLVLSLLSLCIHTQAQECTVDGECDTHERCSVWKEEGECLRNAAYMAEFCPASCVDVELSTGGECKDLHPRCTVWADLGECEDNESEMNRFCPEACEVCPEDLAAAGSEEDELCVDNHVSCEYWTGLGECKSNKRWVSVSWVFVIDHIELYTTYLRSYALIMTFPFLCRCKQTAPRAVKHAKHSSRELGE